MSTRCDLTERHCVPCEGGVAAMTREQAQELLAKLPGWRLNDEATMIERRFEFRGFYRTIAFINAMAWIVNNENHHPDFGAGYNYCRVGFTTHAINGLSENDFICAAKVSALVDGD